MESHGDMSSSLEIEERPKALPLPVATSGRRSIATSYRVTLSTMNGERGSCSVSLVMFASRDRVRGFTRVLRGWWPAPCFVAVAVVAQQVLLTSHYDVGGHAGEHLGSASAPFMAAAILAILFWATPAALRQAEVLFAAVVWFGTTLLVMIGNLRVIDDLVVAGYSHTPTSSVPDVANHTLANSSIWYAVAAALPVPLLFRRRRHIGNHATIGAVAAMIFPPWIIPGAGVVVLTIVRCVTRAKSRTT